jgi:homoserine acetyltransferase
VLSFSSDWLFPPKQSWAMVDALLKGHRDVSYLNIETDAGHDAFLIPDKWGPMQAAIQRFLATGLAGGKP